MGLHAVLEAETPATRGSRYSSTRLSIEVSSLIDRLQSLFGPPGMISERRGVAATVASEALPIEVQKGIIEATRGLAGAPGPGGVAPAPTASSP